MGSQSPSSTETRFLIRKATADDAEAYSRTHVAALHETYADIMPRRFHDHYDADLPNLVERRRLALAENDGVNSWVAFDGSGRALWHSKPMFRMLRT